MDSKSKENKSAGKVLIVIGRQYGSGGRRIGRMLADKLGISYYDKSLLSHAAEQLGYSSEVFRRHDERRPSLLRSLLTFNYGTASPDTTCGPMSDERIYTLQSEVIRDICKRESCVIVGRTADYVMRDHPRMLSLYIHAPLQVRSSAIMEREGIATDKEAAELAARHDKCRAAYYNYYTNSDMWGRAENYHLSIDSSCCSDEAILLAVKDILDLQ